MNRPYMILSACAAVGLLAAASGPTATAQTVVKVGVINTFSGPTVAQGEMMERGLQAYYKSHQKDLPPGVTIQLVERDDTGAHPDIAKRLASELVVRDHVQLLIGTVWSPNAMAVGPVASQAKVPFVDTNAAAIPVTKSPYAIRTSFTLTQQAYPLAKWAAKHGYKTAYTAVSDYAPGQEGRDAFIKGFTEAGGKILGQVTFPPPPNVADFAPFLLRIKDTHPDVVYIFVPAGPTATQIMKAATDIGLQAAKIHLISTEDLVPDEEIQNMGEAIDGLVTSGVYSSFSTRPANQAFVATYSKIYTDGKRPDFETADAWDGMSAIFDLVKATKGKFTGEQAMAFLSNWKTAHSPKGPVMIDPATRQIVQNVYMRRIEKKGGKLVNVEFETIPMVNYLGVPSGMAPPK
ncbi:MAG TPA: ABC transporter substrate-binding protein [Stellaceae bacterium]